MLINNSSFIKMFSASFVVHLFLSLSRVDEGVFGGSSTGCTDD